MRDGSGIGSLSVRLSAHRGEAHSLRRSGPSSDGPSHRARFSDSRAILNEPEPNLKSDARRPDRPGARHTLRPCATLAGAARGCGTLPLNAGSGAVIE